MQDEYLRLGVLAMTSPYWQWRCGMSAVLRGGMRVRVVSVAIDKPMVDGFEQEIGFWGPKIGYDGGSPSYWQAVPDMTDTATLGCLLGVVLEHWSGRFATVAGGWDMKNVGNLLDFFSPTATAGLAETLVEALLALEWDDERMNAQERNS